MLRRDSLCTPTTINSKEIQETSSIVFPVPMFVCVKSIQSCPTLCNPMDCRLPDSSVHRDSPGKNTGEGRHALFQGIYPNQGSNPCLLCLLRWQISSLLLASLGKPPSIYNSRERSLGKGKRDTLGDWKLDMKVEGTRGSGIGLQLLELGYPSQYLTYTKPLEKEMAIHSSTLAWKIPWTEEPGRLQPMGQQKVRHD